MKGKSKLYIFLVLLITIGFCALSQFGIGANKLFSYENIKQGLDLKGGVSVTFEADKVSPTTEEMNTAVSLIRERLDNRNYTEAQVAIENTNRIRVDIPGVEDADTAVNEIGQTAQLSFISEEGELLVSGANVANASVQTVSDVGTRFVVALEFDSQGSSDFAAATAANIGKSILILLDDSIISYPTVNETITGGSAIISGDFTAQEAENLAALIRAGALPFNLKVVYQNNVGATLGADALATSLTAGIIGFVFILLFMLIVYKVLGLSANIALIFYLSAMLIIFSAFGVTLTLPGLAGIVLSIGMAVDANVIIFERIKEELRNGKTLRVAVDNGFSRAFPAILDGNVTTLIASVVLFFLGTGPVKGFAQTLGIGVLLSMFTAIVITKILVKSFLGSGLNNPKKYGVK